MIIDCKAYERIIKQLDSADSSESGCELLEAV